MVSWVASGLVGGVYGIAGTIGHSVMWGPIPIGLIVATIACAAILVAVRALTYDRGATVAAGVGMIGMMVLISGVGPGGSVVVPDSLGGQIWTYLVAGIVLLVIAWPSVSRVQPRSQAPTAQEAEVGES